MGTIFTSININVKAETPVWQTMVSILGGIVFIVVFIILLWRCKFFKAYCTKPKETEEVESVPQDFKDHLDREERKEKNAEKGKVILKTTIDGEKMQELNNEELAKHINR